jgi:hypothetical protein
MRDIFDGVTLRDVRATMEVAKLSADFRKDEGDD